MRAYLDWLVTRHRWVVCLWIAASGAAIPAATLIPGFEDSLVVQMPYGNASNFDFTPAGHAFIGEKSGKVWYWDGSGLAVIHQLSVSTPAERGLNGLAVDPDFESNGHVWIYYTTAEEPIHNRLSRFTYDGSVLTEETVMIEGPTVINTNHNGGAVRFSSAGTLFVSMGEDGQGGAISTDTFDLRGKILHLNRDGSPAAGNPFPDGAMGDPRVWAYGLRNPYRIAVQPGTDNLMVNDVGYSTWEEIDLVYAGANMGWDSVEGVEPLGVTGVVYPVHAYTNNGAGEAITGGAFARPGDLASEYEGDYFFVDFITWELHRMKLDASNKVEFVERIGTDVPWVTDMHFGPEGSLYYMVWAPQLDPHQLRRISYVAEGNRQPVAVASASPDHGDAPLTVALDGTGSYDPDDDDLTYAWDRGDTTSDTGSTSMQTYPAGVYLASLTVVDGNGGSDVTPTVRIVSGNHRPAATIAAPADESLYVAGQPVSFQGSGTDAEEGAVPCARSSWRVTFHHDGMSNPVLGPVMGECSGSFTPATRGVTATDVWYQIDFEVQDTGSPLGADGVLDGSETIEVRPTLATLSLTTTPRPDLDLLVDGQAVTAPVGVTSVAGVWRTMASVNGQLRPDGHTYGWISWSDGGDFEHEVTVMARGGSLKAGFGCDVLVEVNNLQVGRAPGGAVDLSWDAANDICLSDDADRYRIYDAPTPRPTGDGEFPTDPPFELAGSTTATSLEISASPDTAYFLVLGKGTDQQDGPAGHY